MANRRPTSTDVAKLAGVSRATVSYVLNQTKHQSIPLDTQERVTAAAKELGYTPNAAAKALRAGQSNLVLLVVRNIPYGRNLGMAIDRLAEQVAEHGMSLVTWQSAGEQSLTTTLGHLQPRMVLSFFALDPSETRALSVAGIAHASQQALFGVSSFDELTGSLQVHHLAERGHRRIGHVGTDDADLSAFSGPRRQGVRRGCLELDLPTPRETIVGVPPKGSAAEVAEVLRDWCSSPEPVTAVAAYNDQVAALVMRAARLVGLRVPEDLAVIGVDDEPMAAQLEPPLSTVRIDMTLLTDWLLAAGLHELGQGEAPLPVTSSALEVLHRASS
ncbi:MAG: LacI family DNA-binding transcriptional regulator [Micropruina sp.]|nr:LacI family DNA-binding transcriptional regulator [Micropruina sp.]